MINRVILMGRLVADSELKTTGSGVSVTSFRIAVDRSYVKVGEERQTDFFDVVAWRSTAEFVCRNFFKGSLIAVDGQLQSRRYQTNDGQNRTAIEVVADNISFTGERRDDPHHDYQQPEPARYNRRPEPAYQDRRSEYRQQTFSESQQRQREAQQRMPDDARYGGGLPSDGSYMTPDDDLPSDGSYMTPDDDLPFK